MFAPGDKLTVEQKHAGAYLPYGMQLERDHSLVLGWQKAW